MTQAGPSREVAMLRASRERRVVAADDLPAAAERLFESGSRLALAAAHDDGDALRVVYLFTAPGPGAGVSDVELVVTVDPAAAHLPSLAGLSFPASRFEREVHDLYGVEFTGHPRPARLVLHQHWPEGWHPMRRDAGPPPHMDDEGQPYPFHPVSGAGVYEIPVGPVHAGLIEPGHFRFWCVGETIVSMKARLWFVHKGIERLFEGRDPVGATELAERISGDTAVGHNLAYCMAVEDALGCAVAPDAWLLRGLLLELERCYNHVADLGALCNDVGYGILHAHAQRVRERLLRLNKRVTGHRLLRGGIVPGGARVVGLPTAAELDEIEADVREIVALALANSTVVDRFAGTAVLDTSAARDLGCLGYVARGSGLDVDARRDHPGWDPGPAFRVVVRSDGDVMARFAVRAEELEVSFAMLRHALGLVRATASVVPLPEPSPTPTSGVGIVEGWRGTIVHRVEIGSAGLTRVKVVDPSFFNWPALSRALGDTIVPDFPLTNKSFNLSYAGNDL